MPNPDPLLKSFSLLYLVYYFGLSFYLSGKMLKARHVVREAAENPALPAPDRRIGLP